MPDQIFVIGHVNPDTDSIASAMGYAWLLRERDFDKYHIFRADEMPELETIFVETFEPTHPFGVKAVAEIPMDGVAPAVGNAVLDAAGVNVDENPVTPERVWKAIRA
jgi:putative selenate reductase molybdopterin-binding subunit